MPAVSKAQQQAAGAALAAKKKGKTTDLKGAAKSMAKMSKKELEKVASTKHKGLPKHVNESIEEAQQPEMVDEVGSFWVVTRPNEGSTMEDIVFESNVLHFANQVRGGLYEEEVIGIYKEESKAVKTADQLIAAIQNKLKEIEDKKHTVISKIEETIKKLQKEVNRCMDEGNDMKAQEMLQRIAELRSKHQRVEASKKEIEKEEE